MNGALFQLHDALLLFEAEASAAVTGTAVPSLTEVDVVAGGETIIITLTGDVWVGAGAVFDAARQAIIDGLDSAQSEMAGWNAEVRDNMAVTAVVRTSDTILTITLPASASYAAGCSMRYRYRAGEAGTGSRPRSTSTTRRASWRSSSVQQLPNERRPSDCVETS